MKTHVEGLGNFAALRMSSQLTGKHRDGSGDGGEVALLVRFGQRKNLVRRPLSKIRWRRLPAVEYPPLRFEL